MKAVVWALTLATVAGYSLPAPKFSLPARPRVVGGVRCAVADLDALRTQERKGEISAGIGAGRDLPSPSGINTLPQLTQAAIVLGILSAVGFGATVLAGPVFDVARGSFLWDLSRPTWPLLGLIYLAAGIAHFTEEEGFTNITPPNGTWGIFYTPFSPKVNVLWTGAVEVFGGAWMLFGAGTQLAGITLPAAFGPVVSDAALTLFLLTTAVTPANIYALTHGTLSLSPNAAPSV